jgi:hypothetical protein
VGGNGTIRQWRHGDGGAGAKRGLGGQGKPLGLPLIRNRSFSFFSGFPFTEFCSLRHFEVSNSGLTKNLEIGFSFFRVFYFIFFKKFKTFKFTDWFIENRLNQSGPISPVFA